MEGRTGPSPAPEVQGKGAEYGHCASNHMARGPGQGQAFGGISEGEAYFPRKRAPIHLVLLGVENLEDREPFRLLAALGSFLGLRFAGLLLFRGLSEAAVYLQIKV